MCVVPNRSFRFKRQTEVTPRSRRGGRYIGSCPARMLPYGHTRVSNTDCGLHKFCLRNVSLRKMKTGLILMVYIQWYIDTSFLKRNNTFLKKMTGGFPSQRASKAEDVSILWRHHEFEVQFTEWNFSIGNEISFRYIPQAVHENMYRKVSNIRRTKFQNLRVSRSVLQLSWPNLLKPCIKWRMKM